jgi:beta-mannosidase
VNEKEGDSHHYDHGSNYRAPSNWDIRPRFLSEFGHLSLPSMEVIRTYMPAGTEWPITGPMWKYHGTDTMRTGTFRGPDRVLCALQACGMPAPGTIEEAVRASQELQAEAVCAWVEHYCADPELGGFLLWNVADCWPEHSDAVIDYLGHPKAVFMRLGPLFARMKEDRRACHPALP